MDNATLRRCKKCLLREMDESEYFKNMYEYIRRMPKEDKVDDAEYERRLSICKSCDQLISGMCRSCGCYVEMRAAIKVRGCPGVPAKWDSQQSGEGGL